MGWKTKSTRGARLTFVAGLVLAPLGARGFDYVESLDGDIASYDENAPTPIGTLGRGFNTVSGSFSWNAEIYDGDVFSVDVPAGTFIEGITVAIAGHSGGFNASTKVFETPVYQAIDSHLFPADGNYDFLGPPLPPGRYGFSTVSQSGAVLPASYTWEWTIRVPEPDAAAASLAAVVGVALIARRRA